MLVFFRVDASNRIGTGHVMRCLTLAEALRARGAECRFICRMHEGNMLDRIRQANFETIAPPEVSHANTEKLSNEPSPAHADWLGVDWRLDAEQTINLIGDAQPDWLIVDHYALDARWESLLRAHCRKVMVIDDLADRDHDCDLILDQNLVADMAHRYEGRIPVDSAYLLGPEYALLQNPYAELHPSTPPRTTPIQRILVFFGGADNENLTGRTISAFLSLERSDIVLDVVINPNSKHAISVREQVKAYKNINLYEALPSLASLMLKADFAIGAGGATSWERCCMGLPSLVITLAENQNPIAAELDRQGFVRWLGEQDEVTGSVLKAAMEDILNDKGITDWSRRCIELIDGKGTERVAAIISLNSNTQLKARLARLDDDALLLRWTNDTLAYQNAINPNAMDSKSHQEWFYKRLRNPEINRIYIIETEDDFPIGQVTFECAEGVWNIDFALDAAARNSKLSAKLLQIAMYEFRRSMNGVLMFGQFRSDDFDMQKILEEHGIIESNSRKNSLSIAICSDPDSWNNEYIPKLILSWLAAGHQCAWVHFAEDLPDGDICFYLSYGRIVDLNTRKKYKNNLVVHASDLPKGRGWSPTSWLILENEQRIPVTLLEAANEVDAGLIYSQEWFELNGTELAEQWRIKLAQTTVQLVTDFVSEYPESLAVARPQCGNPTYYRKRTPVDSKLDLDLTLRNQFNLFRIVDNENYPAYFCMGGKEFVLKIFQRNIKNHRN